MRVSATLSVIVGAGVGLVAAGAAYAATSGPSASPELVGAVAPQVVTATVTPTPAATCDDGSVLQDGVCVVTIDRTTVLRPTTHNGAIGDSARSVATTDATQVRSDQHGDGEDDHGQHAQDDDHEGDHEEHAQDDDHDGDQGEHADDAGDHDDD